MLEATDSEEAAPVKGITDVVGDGRAPVPGPTGTVAIVDGLVIGYLPVGTATCDVTGIRPTEPAVEPSVTVVKPTIGTVTVMEE